MKEKVYSVELFDSIPPINSAGFARYRFIIHFNESIAGIPAHVFHNRAIQIARSLRELDRGNPYGVECPYVNVETKMVDLDLLGDSLGIPDDEGSTDWALQAPFGSHIRVTVPKTDLSSSYAHAG
jgi:hypothetical protein